ncbi:unnamed protein product [Closterium sp. NIES-53]
MQSCLSRADELEALVELYAGLQRMPALQENKALPEAAEKLPPGVSPQAVAFTKRALLTLQATETRLPTRHSARHMDQEAVNRLMAQVAEMQEGMETLMAEVTTLRGENAELRHARGEARQESPDDEGEGNSQAVSNPLDALTRDFEEEDRQRAASAPVAVTTIKIKPVNPPPFNPTDKTTTVKGWLFGVEVFFTAATRMKLRAWSQMASVQDYTASFMGLADQVDDMSEVERLDKYISGLKYEIQYEPELEELRSQIDALLEKGFIQAITSPFAALILFTPKKDGGLRMCIDYRALNRVTIKSRYPIPRTDDLLERIRGAHYFSKIDLHSGYHRIRVFADDCHKTAFRTRYGSYEFTMMPFGLTNAPLTFKLTMNRVFRDLLDRCVIVYLDDILIFSKTRAQHLRDLDAIFKRLQENQLITKGSKCEFFKQELEFLGHVISRDGIKIDLAKIKTIQEWKSPTNITELQSFLGFVNYVRRFIPNMAGITGPLTDLLHKDRHFVWGEEAEAAFQELKHFLVSPLVLRIADQSRPCQTYICYGLFRM